MTFFLTLAATFAVAMLLWWNRNHGGYMPEPFRTRQCQGASWLRAFPDQSKAEVRAFLRTFGDAFAFRESQKLQVRPDDKIYDIYRALYPKLGGLDALELESLAKSVERRYGVSLRDLWSKELSLGELFAACQPRSQASYRASDA